MKKFMLVLALLALFCVGCNGLDETFTNAVDSNWKIMGPNYRKYIEADTKLPADSKKMRLDALDEFTEMVKEHKVELDK